MADLTGYAPTLEELMDLAWCVQRAGYDEAVAVQALLREVGSTRTHNRDQEKLRKLTQQMTDTHKDSERQFERLARALAAFVVFRPRTEK
jgi:hypothetical protein